MTTLPLVRTAAPTAASNDAHIHTTDAVQLLMAACNGLAEALRLLRTGDLSKPSISRAISRSMRGTTAIKRLAAMSEGGAV